MKTPKRILPLIEDGVIDEVLQQLMSGKEATVYIVRCGTEIRCAKVYKAQKLRPCDWYMTVVKLASIWVHVCACYC